jgi:hypothetical protein
MLIDELKIWNSKLSFVFVLNLFEEMWEVFGLGQQTSLQFIFGLLRSCIV